MEGFNVGSVTAKVQADLSNFTEGMNQAKEQAASAGESISGIAENIRGFAEAASVVVAAQVAVFGLFAKDAIDAGGNIQFVKMNLDNLTGSAQKSDDILSKLQDLIDKGIFTPLEVETYTQKLLQMNVPQEKVNSLLHDMGAAAVGSSANLQDAAGKMQTLTTLLGMLQDKGGLTVGMLNRFSRSLGIPIVDAMAKSLGETTEEFEKTKGATAVTADMLEKAFSQMTTGSGKFANALTSDSTSMQAKQQALGNEFEKLKLRILGVTETGDVIKNGLFDKLSQGLSNLMTIINQYAPRVLDFIDKIGTNKDFQLAIEGFVVALASLAIILPIVVIAFNPMVLIVLAIEALIVLLFIAWNKNFFGIRDITSKVITEVIHFFNDYLRPLIQQFMVFWNAAWPIISAVLKEYWDIMVSLLRLNWDIFYGIIKIGIDLLTGNWKKAWDDIKSLLANVWNDIMSILNNGLGSIRNWAGNVVGALVAPFEQAWGKIQDLMNKIKDALDFTKRHSPSVLDIVQNGVELVNGALTGIKFQPNITANQIAGNMLSPLNTAGYTNAYNGGTNITVQLPNAIISDQAGATRVAELIGNQIINRLKQNVRF